MAIEYCFSGKTVCVTGSARGIGRRIGERFYEAGANVAFCSISKGGKEELMQEVAGNDRRCCSPANGLRVTTKSSKPAAPS